MSHDHDHPDEVLDLEQFIDEQLDVSAIAGGPPPFSIPTYDDFSADLLASIQPPSPDTLSDGSSSFLHQPLLLLPDSHDTFSSEQFQHHPLLHSSSSSSSQHDATCSSSSSEPVLIPNTCGPDPTSVASDRAPVIAAIAAPAPAAPQANPLSSSSSPPTTMTMQPLVLRELQGRNADLAAENAALRKRLGAVARENRAMRVEFARVAPHASLPDTHKMQAPNTTPNSKIAAAAKAASPNDLAVHPTGHFADPMAAGCDLDDMVKAFSEDDQDNNNWADTVKRAVSVAAQSPRRKRVRRTSPVSPPSSPASSAAATTTALCVFCLLGIFVSPTLFTSSEDEQIRLIQLPAYSMAHPHQPSSPLSVASTEIDLYRGIYEHTGETSRTPSPHTRPALMYQAKMDFLRSLRDAPAPDSRSSDSYLMTLDAVSLLDASKPCPLGPISDATVPKAKDNTVPVPFRLQQSDPNRVYKMTFVLPSKALGENRSEDDTSVLEISCNVINVTRHSSPWQTAAGSTRGISVTAAS